MRVQTVPSSFLDCLIGDADEDVTRMPGRTSPADFIASVARDIEALLNCRNVRKSVVMFREDERTTRMGGKNVHDAKQDKRPVRPIDHSVFMLGLPDFSALSLANGGNRMSLVSAVGDAIRTFEPRLSHVEVHLSGDARACASLQFSITANLNVPDVASEVTFEAWFQSMNLQFAINAAKPRSVA